MRERITSGGRRWAPPRAPRLATIAVGDISVTALLDVDLAVPLGIEQVFTDVAAEEWEVHRARYPGAFSATAAGATS